MSNFWATVLGGIASAVLIFALGVLVRNSVQKQSQNRPVLKINIKDLGPMIIIAVGGAIAITGAFLGQGGSDNLDVLMVGLGVFIVALGAVTMLLFWHRE